MKLNDSGEFCILYIEPADEKDAVFEAIGQQKKPVVILLPSSGRARLFQRPEDFSDLKHIKRQQNLAIVFVIAGNEYLRQLASRYGFPSYVSMDALSKALEESRVAVSHQRAMAKTARTRPLVPPEPVITTRKTVPLTQASQQPNVVAPPKPTSSPMHKNPSSPLHRNPSTPLPNVQPPAFVPPVPPPQPKRRSSRAVGGVIAASAWRRWRGLLPVPVSSRDYEYGSCGSASNRPCLFSQQRAGEREQQPGLE